MSGSGTTLSRPVSRSIKAAAYAVPLCVLPSAVWRVHHLATGDAPIAECRRMGWFEPYYVGLLSIVSLGAALLTIGLVRPWGEVFPRWVPRLGGRPVPVNAAVVPAAVGAVLLFGLFAHGMLNQALDYYRPAIPGQCPPPPDGWAVKAAYAPLVLWAPLLAVVTYDYHRRRRGNPAARYGRSASSAGG